MALILAAAACEGKEEESLKGEILRGRLVMAAERDHERLGGTRNGFDEDLSSAEGVGVWERLTGVEGVGGEESDEAADHVDLGGHRGELDGGDEKRDETGRTAALPQRREREGKRRFGSGRRNRRF